MASKLITLYDPENDVVVDLTVSVEDARRAEADLVFARTLMNNALQKMPATAVISQQSTDSANIEGHSKRAQQADTATSEESDSSSTEKKSKESVVSLLKKRLRQKEEEEVARAKRHKQRMEIDREFLTILNKLVNKE